MTDPANPATTLPPRGPGYGARCKACNSPHRAAIDTKLLAGDSTRLVSEWLVSTHGERIPHQGLLNHRTEHLDARAEAAARVEAATPVFEGSVQRIVANVEVLNEVAGIALRTARALEPVISGGKPPMAAAVAFTGALSAARAAVTDRHEMLFGKKLEVTGSASPSEDIDALHARVAAALALPAAGADPGAAGGADPDTTG